MEPEKDKLLNDSYSKNVDFENYFMNTTIPQLFFDKDLILRKFSSGAMKKFNLSFDNLGNSIYELKKHLGCPSIIKNVKWVISKSQILEKEIQTTDLNWFKVDIIPYLKPNENSHNGVIVTFIDITDKIRDIEEQEKLIEEYETLLATISHDIKNGLTSMVFSVQMLKESDYINNEEIKLDLETIDNGVNKINLILKDLHQYNNKKRKYKAVKELVIFENIIEEVKLSLMNEVTKTNTVIKIDLKCHGIIFPRRELRSIIFNLLSNCLKYKSPERDLEIVINVFRENNDTVISVKDNGIGIEPHYCNKVFTKYFRIRNDGEGSGLGLHLIKSIVSKAGGKITCESQLGVGSEFKVYLNNNNFPPIEKELMKG